MKKIFAATAISTILFIGSYALAFAGLQTFSGNQAPQEKNEAYKTDLYTGSATYSYDISVPKGTNGLTPTVSLSYNNQAAHGYTSYAGAGWQIGTSYIEIDRNYSPETNDDKYRLIFQGASYDLIDTGNGTYHTKIESFLNITKLTGGQNTQGPYWQVITQDGTQYRFGYLGNAEITCDYNRIEKWNLDEVTDTHGNKIFYTYTTANNVSYLSKIEYNTEKARVINFSYATSANQRTIRSQFCTLKETQKLTNVAVTANGSAVRSYDFAYTDQISGQPLLQSITEKGNNGTALPATKFEYKPQAQTNVWQSVPSTWISSIPSPGADFRPKSGRQKGDTVLSDVNGDGLPDIVKSEQSGGNQVWRVLLNTGNGWAPSWTTWVSAPIDNALLDDDDTTLADVTGDGLPDIVRSRWDAWFIYANTGSGWNPIAQRWRDTSQMNGAQLSRKESTNLPYFGTQLVDVTGDGMADVVYGQTYTTDGRNRVSEWTVYRSVGTNFGLGEQFMRPLGDVNLGYRNVKLLDVNGDRFLDIVKTESTDANTWKIWMNMSGGGFEGGPETGWYHMNVNATLDQNVNARITVGDANGDGLLDIIRSSNHGGPVNSWEALLNRGNIWGGINDTEWTTLVPDNNTMPDVSNDNVRMADVNGDGLIDIVRSETNGPWDVWKNTGNAPDFLSRVITPLGGSISFDYGTASSPTQNPKLPFPLWTVTSLTKNNGMTGNQAMSMVTSYSYAGGMYDYPSREFRGFNSVTEANPIGTKTKYTFLQDDAKKGKTASVEVQDAQGNQFKRTDYVWSTFITNSVNVVNLTSEKNATYDGVSTNPKVTQSDYLYDAYGNATRSAQLGDIAVTGDERFRYAEYTVNPAAWIMNSVKHTYLRAADDLTKVNEEWFYYDSHPGIDDAPTKGDQTKNVKWSDTITNPFTQTQYDMYGNKTKLTDANNHATTYTYGVTDSTFTYPEKITNAKNHTTSYVYNLGTGNLTSMTNPNGTVTTYEYDIFGRKTKEIQDGDTSSFPTMSYQYFLDGNAPEGTLISKRVIANLGDSLNSYTFVDGFGRTIQTRSDSEDQSKQIVSDTWYDTVGRIAKVSIPHADTLATTFVTPVAGIGTTQKNYDAIDRIKTVINPDNTTQSVIYDHWTTTSTDENGNTKKQYLNAFGKIAQIDERNGSSTYVTKYSYNAKDDVTSIINANGTPVSIVYDSMGRKKQQTDPDLGTWKYEYDGVGNMIKQTDARAIVTQKTYDELNRVKTIDYPTDTDVLYAYDIGKIGTLSSINDASGITTFTYDNRLHKVSETRVLDGITWNTQYTYDSADRLVNRTNPDGEVVRYGYNRQGTVNIVNGILNTINYNAFGKITKKEFANTLTTNYTYDSASNRLKRIQTGSVQDLNYTYDNVGNVKTIVNATTAKTQTFGYDALDRLISASENVGYSHTYTYDPIGNLTKLITGTTPIDYTYGTTTLVHAPLTSSETVSAPSTTYTGEFFDNQTLTGTPKVTRQDATINFDWGSNSPDLLIPADHFSVRWTRAPTFTAGAYIFSVTADDGVRLKIDGVTVIDKWVDQGPTTYTVTKTLTAGMHTIVMEYYENGGGATAKMSYAAAPALTPTPTPSPTPPPGTTYSAEYFDNQNLTGTPKLTRQDTAIDFSWGTASPDPLIPVDHFSARWTKSPVFTAGDYQFSVTADDGVRLKIDGVTVIDKWIDQSPTSYTVTKTLTAGAHTIVMEYYENGYDATAKFSYAASTPITNVALNKVATADSVLNTYIASYGVDGLQDNAHRWVSTNTNGPHWLAVDLGGTYTIQSSVVTSGYFDAGYGYDTNPIPSWVLQSWNGSTWVDIPGTTISGNTSFSVSQTFTAPITTTKVRLYSTVNGNVRLRDLVINGR